MHRGLRVRSRTLPIALVATFAAFSAPAATIRVSVVAAQARGAASPAGHVTAIGPEGTAVRAPFSSWGEEVSVEAPTGPMSVSAEVEGMWCGTAVVGRGEAGPNPVFVTCWPAGRATGTVGLREKGAEVSEVVVRFQARASGPGSEPGPAGLVTLPLRKGRWETELPVGALDLSLRAKGLVPQYFWDVTVEATKVTDLGRLELRSGASLIGYVAASSSARIKPEECLATLRPQIEKGRDPEANRSSLVSRTARPNARGFFQIDGAAAGRWELVASQPGLVEATRTIDLAEGMEASLAGPLVLGPYARFDVQVHPPRDPDGETWSVDLLEVRPSLPPQLVVGSSTRTNGSWTYERVVDGRKYLVRLQTHRAVGWWQDAEAFEMGPANRVRSIDVGVEKIRGTVLLGRRPLAATLTFGEEGHFPAIGLESDATGRFEGVLPRRGPWRVSVRSAAPAVARAVDVQVPSPASGDVSEVEIRLLAGGFQGEIVDTDGNRVPHAVLRMRARERQWAKNELIRDGSFLIEGLLDGEYGVSADTKTAQSDGLVVTLSDGEVSEPLRIVLHPLREIRGRTLTPGGSALPMARVQRLPEPSVMLTRGQLPPAGMDGRWIVEVPSTQDGACLILSAPGYATRLLRMEARPEEQDVPMPQMGGQLVLVATKMPLGGPFPALFHQGCMSYQRSHNMGAAEVEERGNVRMEGVFEPGEYSLCMITEGEFSSYAGGRPAFPSCSHGTLLPAGRLELTAPDR